MWQEVLFRKPDLDTLVCALVAGVNTKTLKRHVDKASEDELSNPEILCIEVGGTGRVEENNFDHHDPDKVVPPACVQAWIKFKGNWEMKVDKDKFLTLERLVNYTHLIDEGRFLSPDFPGLTHIVSGILLAESEPLVQFERGLEILGSLVNQKFNPFYRIDVASLEESEVIERYLYAKQLNQQRLKQDLERAFFYYTRSGKLIGVLVTGAIGGMGALFAKGADAVVLHNPEIRKFTICSKELSLTSLLKVLNSLEDGWGGRNTIIGSPFDGSQLSLEQVLKTVEEVF